MIFAKKTLFPEKKSRRVVVKGGILSYIVEAQGLRTESALIFVFAGQIGMRFPLVCANDIIYAFCLESKFHTENV